MAMTNMGTYTTVNGVQEYSVDNLLTSATASATNEQILLRASGTIRASGAVAVITFTNCNLCLNDVANTGNWFDSGTAPLTYYGDSNNRNDTSLALNFVDCSIIHRTTTTRAIFLSDLINTKIFREVVSGGGTFRVYTQGGANLDGMLLDNVTWEPVLQFSSASNVTLQNTGTGFTNFNVPRMDFLYLTEINVGAAASLGTGNGGNNSIVIINAIAFDDTTISMQSVNSKYFKIITSSWNFKDRDNNTNVEDALVIVNSDKSGSMTELGRYTTDSDGSMTGTYDSLNETTGANQVRETLYIWPSYSDTAGSSHGGGAFTYDLIDVDTEIEIRAYGYEPPVGYVLGDIYALTEPQGTLNADYSVDAYQVFTMNNDLNMTESNKVTVLAYTDLGDEDKLYDRSRAEWRDNDNYALISKVGSQLDLDTINLTIDATAGSVYTANTTSITAKAATYTGGITSATGTFTVSNGALLNGGVFDADVDYVNAAGATITNIICTGTFDFDTAGTYTVDGSTLNIITNSSGGAVTLLLANGSTVVTNTGPNITLIQNVDVVNTGLLDGTRVQLYNITQAAELDNSLVSGGTGYSLAVNLLSAAVNPGDTLRIRGTYINGVTGKSEYFEAGTITSSGLSFIGVQQPSPEYDAWGLDGSLITKFTADYVNDEVDVVVGVNFEVAELGAWWQYNLTTEEGIRDFFGGLEFVDEANILIHNAIVNIFMDNITATNVHQTDNRRLYRDDLVRPVTDPTTGAGGIDIEWRSPVTIANSDAIQTDLTDILIDTNRVDGLIEDVGGDRYTAKALEEGPSGSGTTPAAVWAFATRGLTEEVTTDLASRTASQADVSGLSVFNSATDEVITDTASRNASKADVSGLSTFNPTTDTVANVTTVQTTVSNTDMRGTDGANTIAPDNAGITNNGNAIAVLNDFDPSSEVVTTDTASRDASKADVSALGTKNNQTVINDNVKSSSLIIPASTNLPD